MDPIGPDIWSYMPLNKKNDIFHFVYTLASTNTNQSAPTLNSICAYTISNELDYGSNRKRTTGVICPRIGKIASFNFVYTLVSTIINHLAPHLVKINMTITSQMTSINRVVVSERL